MGNKVIDGNIEWIKDADSGEVIGYKAADGTEKHIVGVETDLLTGGIEFPIENLRYSPVGAYEAQQVGRDAQIRKFVGAYRQIQDAGSKTLQFDASKMSVRVGSPTFSNVSTKGGISGGDAIDGSHRAVKFVCTSSNDQVDIFDANVPDFAIDNMIGVLVFIKNLPGRHAGETEVAQAVEVNFGLDPAGAFTNYVSVLWNTRQLREGWNFLVWKPSATQHPAGTFVTNAGTGLAQIVAGGLVKKLTFGLQGMNAEGTEVYLTAMYNGFRSKGGVVFNIDSAGSDLIDTVIPYMTKNGWVGNIFSCYDSSMTKTLDTIVPVDMQSGPASDEFAYRSGWQISPHSMTHRNAASITDSSELWSEIKLCQEWIRGRGFSRGLEFFAAPQNYITIESYAVNSAAGCVIQRGYHHQNVQPMFWGIDNGWIGSTGIDGGRSVEEAWAEIDACLQYGALTAFGWHNVITDGDPNDGSGYTGAGSSASNYWSVLRTIFERIKAKEDAGEIIVFRGFDEYCYGKL